MSAREDRLSAAACALVLGIADTPEAFLRPSKQAFGKCKYFQPVTALLERPASGAATAPAKLTEKYLIGGKHESSESPSSLRHHFNPVCCPGLRHCVARAGTTPGTKQRNRPATAGSAPPRRRRAPRLASGNFCRHSRH